jgi:hypothetical protein
LHPPQWIEDIKHVCNLESFEYPLFCDPHREKAVELGIIDASNKDAQGLPLTVRSVFILKPDRTIALMMTYPASTGRNFDEIIRVIDSLQLTANQNLATPVVRTFRQNNEKECDCLSADWMMALLIIDIHINVNYFFFSLMLQNWKPGDECIVNFPLTDAQATEKFGKDGYRIQDVPSEKGKDLAKHYLRWTKAA